MAHTARRLGVLVFALAFSGCATSAALRAGQSAEQLQDFDRAIMEYTKVLRDRPDDREARRGLERARLRASLDHFSRGRRLSAAGRLEEALVELQLASELNPASAEVDTELRSVRAQLKNKVALAREGKTELETLIERARSLPPVGPDFPGDARLPGTITFRDASVRDIYTALARLGGVSVAFDAQFRDQTLTTDLRPSSLDEALQSVSVATRNFYRVTAPRMITVIPDTPAKRREYEEEVVGTFYLSNADLKETADTMRIVIDATRVATVTANNAIVIKDTPDRVAAAAALIRGIDKARPEVIIDVELLEIDRTRLREYGLQIASPGSPGISGSVDVGDSVTLRDLRNLTQANIFLTNLPALFYRLVKQDSNTRTLANPQLRTTDGIPAVARFGDRIPLPVTTFAPIAQGGLNQQPFTSYNYADIGVNIDITPRTHHDDQVSLALKIEVSSISGSLLGLPTIGNRSINTVIQLHDGETNLLAGLIRDDERRVMAGIPGLSDLPIVGRLFAHSTRETQETDIVLTVTPRIVRALEVTETDLRPFRVGRDGDGRGRAIDLPLPPPVPAQPGAPPPEQPQQPGTVGPILSPRPIPAPAPPPGR
jgi:general secretion pathway protein D